MREKKEKKKIDFLIYYRKHKNKEFFFPYKLIRILLKNNFGIVVIGDKLEIPKVKNLGKLSNKKFPNYNLLQNILLLLAKTCIVFL